MKKEDTHNVRFAKLQDEYLENRKPETLVQMYTLVREIESNYILDYMAKHGLFFNSDEFQDKIEDATIFVIDKYLKRKDFRIEKLSAYAHFFIQRQRKRTSLKRNLTRTVDGNDTH